jgi:hypothetical protein
VTGVRPYVVIPYPDSRDALAGGLVISGVVVYASHPRLAAREAFAHLGPDRVIVCQLAQLELRGYAYQVTDDEVIRSRVSYGWDDDA